MEIFAPSAQDTRDKPLQESQMTETTLVNTVGHTPLVELQRFAADTSNRILVKLEGNNPAGSVKDRPALNMVLAAEARGDIKPGDTLIEATSGNTGIALSMVAAMRGYRMVILMAKSATQERKDAMRAYGAELILTEDIMEARDRAAKMAAAGEGWQVDQFSNQDNALAHYQTTGPEIWQATQGKITHFVSAMGTTGTIMGVGRYLKEQNPDIQIVGLQPDDVSNIAGIRKWPKEYLPAIYDDSLLDRIIEVDLHTAEVTARRMAREEGICAGVSSGGAMAGVLTLSAEEKNAVIVTIACDRGDRYLSTGLFGGG